MVSTILAKLNQRFRRLFTGGSNTGSFPGSQRYWENRYREGNNSGAGSYGRLAEFKAQVINDFVRAEKITSVVEFGCGDGHQLSLADYPRYLGLDVSEAAIKICQQMFSGQPFKQFAVYPDAKVPLAKADLALSLDVIYHLVEDNVFESYMRDLFASAKRFVIIYSSKMEKPRNFHERHRDFSIWIQRAAPKWRLIREIANPYPYDPAAQESTSDANFYFYELA